METSETHFDWGFFEANITSPSASFSATGIAKPDHCSTDYSFAIYRAFNAQNGTAMKISDADVIKAACSLQMTCENSNDVFYLLSCINLLDAAIKTPRWKDKLNFADIKSRAADIFTQCIDEDEDGFEDVQCYYNKDERCANMKVFGAFFSFHQVRMNYAIESFCSSSLNKPLRCEGIRLQMIAPKVMEMASDHSEWSDITTDKLEMMAEQFRQGTPRLYFRARPNVWTIRPNSYQGYTHHPASA